MRQLTILLFILSATCSSCYKTEDKISHGTKPTYDVRIGYLYIYKHGEVPATPIILSTEDSSNFTLLLLFNLVTGDPSNYPMSCSITGLPVGMTVSSDSFTFKLNREIQVGCTANIEPGTYSFDINIYTPDEGKRTFKITLLLTPIPDYAADLVGTYKGVDPCKSGSSATSWTHYNSAVTMVAGARHLIKINNYHGLGDSIYAEVVVNKNGTIDIPVQTINGYTFHGSNNGHWNTRDGHSIYSYGDTIMHNGDTSVCSVQLDQ